MIPGSEANNQYRPIGSSTCQNEKQYFMSSQLQIYCVGTCVNHHAAVPQHKSYSLLSLVVRHYHVGAMIITEALTSDVLIIRISVNEVPDGDPAHLAGAMMSVRYRDKRIVITQYGPQTETLTHYNVRIVLNPSKRREN